MPAFVVSLLAVVCMVGGLDAAGQGPAHAPGAASEDIVATTPPDSAAAPVTPPEPPLPDPPHLHVGSHTVYFGFDFSFVAYTDKSLDAAMGRERQMVPAFVNIALYGDYGPRLSYRVEINPVEHGMEPRPYVPHEDDRRTYFFPNQPAVPGERGVVSDPAGLYHVDYYKTLGVDPIAQLGALRVGYVDFHTTSRRFGVLAGRFYVPQGLGLDQVDWFSAKDLAHMQVIDAGADNGLLAYADVGNLTVEFAVVTGNDAGFHDYGYYDFTYGEDKNSDVAKLVRGTYRPVRGLLVGASAKHNYVNSRIEDDITLSTSKRYDNAFTGFVKWRQSEYLTVFGEVARYKWGLRDTSAELLPGPPIRTPIFKDGYYVGVEATSPAIRRMRVAGSYTRSELDRDDSLVAWATANDLFDVRLGKKERSSIYKLQARVADKVALFWFLHDLSNPFPELSAIKPIAGPNSERPVSNTKSGVGLKVRF
jgi:hypothetical protein